ncbi:hypothetical protein [Pseudomonas putida]|nr:hypothetical protein [Pseudomonas putida]
MTAAQQIVIAGAQQQPLFPDEAEDLIAANAKDLIDLYQREAA